MKIGILTYHRTLNYGAVMQALALRFVLQKMGHDVYYVDYWPKYHQDKYALFSFHQMFSKGAKKAVSYLKNFLKNYSSKKERIENFRKFFAIYIDPFCSQVTENFDIVIYGSDQIWRKQSSLKAYNPVYFGVNDIKALQHVSYAASMGVLPQSDKDYQCVKNMLHHLSKISVREENLLAMVKEMGFSDAVKTLDPTLLLSHTDWDNLLSFVNDDKPKERYVLFYDLMYNSFDLDEIKKFTRQYGMKLKILSGYASKAGNPDKISCGGPNVFLSLIRNADFVFTSSFHGLVFSIIYNKPFYAAFRENEGRALSLLQNLGIPNKLLAPMQKISLQYEPIDYMKINKNLEELKKSSLDFLKNLG